jgi:hypothetical protein
MLKEVVHKETTRQIVRTINTTKITVPEEEQVTGGGCLEDDWSGDLEQTEELPKQFWN